MDETELFVFVVDRVEFQRGGEGDFAVLEGVFEWGDEG